MSNKLNHNIVLLLSLRVGVDTVCFSKTHASPDLYRWREPPLTDRLGDVIFREQLEGKVLLTVTGRRKLRPVVLQRGHRGCVVCQQHGGARGTHAEQRVEQERVIVLVVRAVRDKHEVVVHAPQVEPARTILG